MRRLRQLLLAGLLFSLLACSHALQVGDQVQLPEISLDNGQRLNAVSLRNKPVLIVLWASWCPYCARHLPYLEKLYQQSRNSDLQIIAVSIDAEPAKARAYLQDKKYHFPVSFDVVSIERSVGIVRGLPRTILIDRHGRVAVHELGEMFEEDVLALQRFARSSIP